MSYQDGMAAMNLEMPARIPRTEYSAPSHWELVSAVTGIPVGVGSPPEIKRQAQAAFVGQGHWNYDINWSTLIGGGELGEYATSMGHAVYAAGGVDYDNDIHESFASPEEALSFDPVESLGKPDHQTLVRRFEEHYKANRSNDSDAVNMTGIYITCVSGLIALYGWDMLLLSAGVDQKKFGALTNRYAQWIQQYYDALADADIPVVMVHDDIVWTAGPFISPEWYRTYVFPNYKRYFEPLIDSGKKILFTSDGNFTTFIDDIAACGVHGFAMEPTTDMRYIAERYGKSHVFIGNADTRALLSNDRDAIRGEVERCISIGKDCPGFFMAVGNHIPSNTPVDAAIYYNQVYEELSRR